MATLEYGACTVWLTAEILAALKTHRIRQAETRLAADTWFDDDLIACTPLGTPINPNNVSRSFERLAGVPRIRVHDLRHTAATLLLLSGVPAKIVSERLGPASITITLDLYSHVLPDMQDQAADAMNALMKAWTGSWPPDTDPRRVRPDSSQAGPGERSRRIPRRLSGVKQPARSHLKPDIRGPNRMPVPTRLEREYWRSRLFDHLRKLSPLSNATRRLSEVRSELGTSNYLSGPCHMAPEAEAVRLRLTFRGRPALWAVQALNQELADVEWDPKDPKSWVTNPERRHRPMRIPVRGYARSIYISMSPIEGSVDLFSDGADGGAERTWSVRSDAPLRFADWERLRAAATEAVDVAIDQLQAQFEAQYVSERDADWKERPYALIPRNRKSRRPEDGAEVDWEIDYERLAHILAGSATGKMSGNRIRRRCALMGIDRPVRGSRVLGGR